MNGPLTIIIVNYNSGEALRKCLESVFCKHQGISLNVIVVDNHSWDGSNDRIEVEFPDVMNIRNDENLGFAKACNQGLKFVQGNYLLFLNPDTLIEDDALDRCVEFMDLNPDVGVLGCKLRNPDGSLQPSCADFPFIHKLALDHILRNRIFPDALREKALLKYWAHDEIRKVDWILGAFMLVRRKLMEDLKGFDERFFLYGEDLELCYRIRKTGLEVVFFSNAEIIHIGNPMWDDERKERVHHALLTFYRKHLSLWQYILLRSLLSGHR